MFMPPPDSYVKALIPMVIVFRGEDIGRYLRLAKVIRLGHHDGISPPQKSNRRDQSFQSLPCEDREKVAICNLGRGPAPRTKSPALNPGTPCLQNCEK